MSDEFEDRGLDVFLEEIRDALDALVITQALNGGVLGDGLDERLSEAACRWLRRYVAARV